MSRHQIEKDIIFLEIAKILGGLGTCSRAHVGAVITKEGRCISWGYNGAPPGMPHCDENGHGWADVDRGGFSVRESIEMNGCRNAVHAEMNALAFAARQGISTEGCTLYVERTCCLSCAQLAVTAGITRAVAEYPYRNMDGWELLATAGIELTLIHPYDKRSPDASDG